MEVDSTRNSNHPHGGSCGITPTECEYMTGEMGHTCTAACCHIHLSARLRDFEQHLQRLSVTLPVRNFLWYRDAVIATFATILEGKSHA